MHQIAPRTGLRDGLALCVLCFGEYRPMQTSVMPCGHAVCTDCDSDYTIECPVCNPAPDAQTGG